MFGGLMKFLTGSKQMHDIVGGNTLSGIAQQYGTSQDNLMSMNPQITNPDQIMAGEQMQVGQTPGLMDRFGYGEGQWAPGKGIGMAGAGLYNMFKGLGGGGASGVAQNPYVAAPSAANAPPPPVAGPQNQQQGFMDRMMKGTGGNPGLLSKEGLAAMTGHLNQPQEDFTQYISDVQEPVSTWGESRTNKADNWY